MTVISIIPLCFENYLLQNAPIIVSYKKKIINGSYVLLYKIWILNKKNIK